MKTESSTIIKDRSVAEQSESSSNSTQIVGLRQLQANENTEKMPGLVAAEGQSDVSSDASSAPPLPFEHATTTELVQELNEHETTLERQYQELFAAVKARDSAQVLATSWSKVSIESVLGEGAFSFVFQVRFLDHEQDPTARESKERSEDGVYALKCLKAKSISDSHDLLLNAMDLSSEAQILSRVQHPNIIQLVGWSAATPLGDSYLLDNGYFVLLEIMETTLLDELDKWREKIVESGRSELRRLQSNACIVDRLKNIALPTASAMEYLHESKIVLRDLKPENIGFDVSGTVKLFDFGLARPVAHVEADDVAGSPCYMAPEILLEQGTHLESDVYSLTMVLWELCTLEIPLARFDTLDDIKHHVAKRNWRPPLSGIIPRDLKKVLQKGWSRSVADRPSLPEIQQALKSVCDLDGDGPKSNDSKGGLVRSFLRRKNSKKS